MEETHDLKILEAIRPHLTKEPTKFTLIFYACKDEHDNIILADEILLADDPKEEE